ncbi:MAG: restriction endonuclease subunit S [Patescibacteria group bacterium]
MPQTVLLGDICTKVTSGGTPSTKHPEYYNGDIPWLRTQEVKFGNIYRTEKTITDSGLKNSSAKLIPENSVIIAMYGATAGKSAINKIPLTTNQACCNLIIDHKKADYRYVYYYLLNNYEKLLGAATGAAQQNLGAKQIASMQIILPTLDTQNRIVSILGSIDEKIELNRKMNDTLEQIGKALFRHYFITNPEAEKWGKQSIYELAEIVNGAPFSSKFFNEECEGIPLIRIRDLKSQVPTIWTTENHKKGRLIKAGDIIAGMDAEFKPIIWARDPAWLNQRVCAFEPKTTFISKLFLLETIRPQLAFYENTKIGTTVIHLSKTDIDRFTYIDAPKEIMAEFSSIANPIYDQQVVNSREIQYLITLRDILLPRLISGKIKV